MTAVVAWVSLSALCLTILILANHAVEALALRLKNEAAPAIAAEFDTDTTRLTNRGDGGTAARETGDSSSCPRCRHKQRSRHDRQTEVATDAMLGLPDVIYSEACELCNAETGAPKTGDETRRPGGTSAANNPGETAAPETSAETGTGLPAASEYSGKAHNWYCKNNDVHARPPLPAEFNFIARHDGYWIGKEGCGKVIYLTFDAGYENGNIAKVLDILKVKNVPAAFFILENIAKREPQLVKRMADEGHLVCNHTANHKDMTKLSESEFTDELARLEAAAKEHAGVEIAKFYRPPSGTFSERDLALAQKLGYKTIMWSYAYADWDNNAQPIPDKALDKLLGHTHEGMVLLLHPTSATNAEILDDFIDRLQKDGWRFGTLTELTSS